VLLGGSLAALARGRRLVAGFCLAGMICIEIYPAFLLLHPLARRDGRCLLGCALGLLCGLVLIPLAVIGPERTAQAYQHLSDGLIRPALGLGGDGSRALELTNVTATDSQSFVAMIHNTLYLDRATRPAEASLPVR